MSIFSKIGKVFKKILPVAAPLAAFIPGIGPAVAAGVSGIGSLFSGSSGSKEPPNYVEMASQNPAPPNNNEAVSVFGKSLGNVVPSIAQIAAPAIAAGTSYAGQNSANAANLAIAQKQMDFQAQQSATSWQRGVADMKAAGLNPMLAYSQGGASSGAGATARMENDLGAGANSALSAYQTIRALQNMDAQQQQIDAQTDVLSAQKRNIDADTANSLLQPPLIGAHTKESESSASQREADTKGILLRNRLLSETFEAQKSEISSAAQLRGAQVFTERGRGAEAYGRGRVSSSFGDLIGEGFDTINSAKKWLGNNLGGGLYDLVSNISSAPSALRKYGSQVQRDW